MTENDKIHYFDWAATAPADEDILQNALTQSLKIWGNPSSIHQSGKEAKEFLADARKKAGEALGVNAENIYFTSGGTESDHIPLLAMLTRPVKGTILVSSIEHPALREQCQALKNLGWNIVSIPSNSDGIITPQAVESCCTKDTVLVCIMAVNNETGAIQPVYEIADKITELSQGRRRPKFHVDCVQAAGKIPINLKYKGIDSAAFSAHKICGPRGIGILYCSYDINPFLRGGGQEKNVRSGTENLFGAKAMADCLERYIISDSNPKMQERFELQKQWTAGFIEKLMTLGNCTMIPHSRKEAANAEKFSPWVVQASFKTIPGQVMVRALSSNGFYISTGSACSAKKQSRPILEAMHVSHEESETAVRFSFGCHTTKQAMDELFEQVRQICADFSK